MEAAGLLEENPDQDLLGVAYTKLGLGDAKRGQYFTPYNICKMMAKMMVGERGCLEAEIEERYRQDAFSVETSRERIREIARFASECHV